jgi:serine/threonine-protein kinase
MALSAATLALVVAGGVFLFGRSQQPEPQPQAQAAPPPTVEPTPPPAPPPAAPVAPATAAAAAPADARRVQVVIIPADASVEVEGERAQLVGGVLDLTAPLGETRKVRVFKGPSETISYVTVAQSGAMPPKIELRPGALNPKAPATGAPTAAPAPGPAPAKPGGIIQDTGEFGK